MDAVLRKPAADLGPEDVLTMSYAVLWDAPGGRIAPLSTATLLGVAGLGPALIAWRLAYVGIRWPPR